jgi:hypothetical protein
MLAKQLKKFSTKTNHFLIYFTDQKSDNTCIDMGKKDDI